MTPSALNLESLANQLLLKIRLRPGQPKSIADLEKGLGVDRATLNAALQLLISYDYRLKIRKQKVIFIGAPDALTENEVNYRLKTRWLGQSVKAFRSVKSTNDLAHQMAEDGASEGTIVTAELQTAGRGRLGRSWHSPPGTGIYVSMILRPNFSPRLAPGMSIVTATTLADVISHYCPGEVKIKWPNDVLIGGKKTAGILMELSAEQNKINHLIVGVGINVNHGVGAFPEEIRKIATSLRRAARHKVNRVELLQRFLTRFEKDYLSYSAYGLAKSISRVRRYSSLIGRLVKLKSGRNIVAGKAIAIDADGYLVLDVDGKQIAVSAGEVTVVRE